MTNPRYPFATSVVLALIAFVSLLGIQLLWNLRATEPAAVTIDHHHLIPYEALRVKAPERPEAKYGFPTEGGVPRPGFTTKINGRTHQPDWVQWKVEPGGQVERNKYPWTNDPNVPPDQRQHAKAYEGQHWRADGVKHQTDDARIERGHMKQADNSKGSPELMAACMVLEDNICPQTSRLNQVVWRGLELFVTKTAETPRVGVLCCTGPLWYADEGESYTVQVLSDGTPVPTHFFKACVVERSGGHVELMAWVLPNTDKPPADFEQGATSTDEVERRGGFNLWPTLPGAEKMEAVK